jgi:Ser/Thr protein kinase RdoA (MazF antagonist)
MRTVDDPDFAALSRGRQLGRLRHLGRAALTRYGVSEARLTLLRHEHNTTFRVDSAAAAYLLRINRPGVYTPAVVESELTWLVALERDTDLGVPEPVAARDGSLLVVARADGVPEPRSCVLLRWLDGRFVDRRLAPAHLRRIGVLAARLQEHAASWTPPSGFRRPRVDTLTGAAKAASAASSARAAMGREHPSLEDGERAIELVETLVSRADAATVARALDVVRGTTSELERDGDAFGLLHGDLHYENVLFKDSAARAIDFDDCGWGFFLYDLAVALREVEDRPEYDRLQDALLEGYAGVRPLPEGHARHLAALNVLRRLQILMWILESRAHAAFRDAWRTWAREELDALALVA